MINIICQIRLLYVLNISLYFIFTQSLSGQSNSESCFCAQDSISLRTLNWQNLDSSINLQFINDYSIDSNGISYGNVCLMIFDAKSNKLINKYILKIVDLGECDRSYSDFCVVNSLSDSPKVIILREEYHNDCKDIHDLGIFILELKKGKIEYSRIL